MATRFYKGPIGQVIALHAAAHSELGYPRLGRNAETNEVVLPFAAIPVREVEGIGLEWMAVIISPVDPTKAYFQFEDDAVDGAQNIGSDLLDAVDNWLTSFPLVQYETSRDYDLFPEFI